MILERFPDVQGLSVSEKLLFVSELWNDLETRPEDLPISQEIVEGLNHRMERFRENPDVFTTWEAVKGVFPEQGGHKGFNPAASG